MWKFLYLVPLDTEGLKYEMSKSLVFLIPYFVGSFIHQWLFSLCFLLVLTSTNRGCWFLYILDYFTFHWFFRYFIRLVIDDMQDYFIYIRLLKFLYVCLCEFIFLDILSSFHHICFIKICMLYLVNLFLNISAYHLRTEAVNYHNTACFCWIRCDDGWSPGECERF
jgi:hypothetical protein